LRQETSRNQTCRNFIKLLFDRFYQSQIADEIDAIGLFNFIFGNVNLIIFQVTLTISDNVENVAGMNRSQTALITLVKFENLLNISFIEG